MGAFISSPLPPVVLRHDVQQGPFALRTLLRFIATTNLAATVSPSVDFPVDAGYTTALASSHFPVPLGRGRFLQLLSMSLSPCYPYPPRQSVTSHQSVCAVPCCLRPGLEGSASGPNFFEAITGFTDVMAR